VNKEKTDYYRYDISQNISETVLANDKGYKVLAWSRDQERLLCQDPKTSEVLIFDIQTLERKSLYSAISPRKVLSAAFTPDNKQLYILETDGTKNELRSVPMTSPTEIGEDIKVIDESGTNRFVFSTNGKFLFLYKSGGLTIKELATGAEYMPPIASAVDAITNPRENWLLLTKESPNGKVVQLIDVGKKTSVDLTTIK
jgi:WD40 repeat protein